VGNLLNKIAINKAKAKRKSFILALAMVGFKPVDDNFNKMPLELAYKKLGFNLHMFNSNCVIVTPEGHYKIDSSITAIKGFMDKQERLQELRSKVDNYIPF
jgi:hypothetical protein